MTVASRQARKPAKTLPAGSISAIVITFNEAGNIADCLARLKFCDEVIVVDSGSSDDTVAIARKAGAKVHHRDWTGFGAQKAHALSLARGEWVLSVDADERIPDDLATEILAVVRGGEFDGYEIARKAFFLDRWMRHSGWWPDYVLRLVRRGTAVFSDDIVHERMIPDGRVGRLREALLHYTMPTLGDAYTKADRYAEAGAVKLVAAGRRPSVAMAFARGGWSFFATYIIKLGILDGREGLINASIIAQQTLRRYLLAWEMTHRKP